METRSEKVGSCWLSSEKGQRKARKRMDGLREYGVGEMVNRKYSSLNDIPLSSSQLKNICGYTHAKHRRKGHDEQDLAATSWNVLWDLEDQEINMS